MILTVGTNQQFPSLQHAINFLVNSLANPVFTQTVTIEVYDGVYGGCIVPASSLFPTSTYKLILKARPGNNVTLSGLITSTALGHGYRTVGIGIGDNTPNVEIIGLKIENFHKGIVLGGLCNRAVVKNCLLRLNTNVGLWVYRSEECQAINNVFLDHTNSLVASEVNDLVLAHNDFINITDPPGTTQFNKYCVHLTTKQPSSYQPNGTIALYNNNFSSNGGQLIGHDENIIAKLRSNYNNFDYSSCVFSKNVSRNTTTTSLSEWQTISNSDQNSLSSPVNYYIPTQLGSSLFTNINLGNFLLFDGVANGLGGLCNSTLAPSGTTYLPATVLPYYADSAAFCQTVQTNYGLAGIASGISLNRPTYVSIGAYDSNIDNNGYASSIIVPIESAGSSTNDPNCQGGKYTSLNVIEEKFSQSVECIHPKVKAGYFYVNDAQYYLYASKTAYQIKDVTWSEFVLSAELINTVSDGTNGIDVIYDGQSIPKSNILIRSNRLYVSHKGLNISDWNNHIHVLGSTLRWVTSGFNAETVRHTFRIRDGKTRYFLPAKPTRGAPIVITDDNVTYSDDNSLLNREFRIEENKELDKVEVIFYGPQNLIENPQFDYPDYFYTGYNFLGESGYGAKSWPKSGDIDCWIVDKITTTNNDTTYYITSGRLGTDETLDGSLGDNFFSTGLIYTERATGTYDLYPVIGRNMLGLFHAIDSRSNTYQVIKVDDSKPYWLSAYFATVKEPGEVVHTKAENIDITWQFYNNEFVSISNTGSLSLPITSDYRNINSIWNRVAVPYGNTVDNTLGKQGPTDVILPASMLSNPFSIPSGAAYYKVAFSTTGFICMDAVAFTQGKDLYPYTRNYRYEDATVEYDTGLSNLYFLKDLTITAARNSNSNGFLYIPSIPARQFDAYAPQDVTTLTDWYWATGRLSYLPWAKTSGKNKLNYRASFNLEPKLVYDDITISPTVGYPDSIEVIPRVPISNLKDGIGPFEQIATSNNDPSPGIKGTDIVIRVTDNNNNPYAFEGITCKLYNDLNNPESFRFNGYLGVKELGIFTQYNSAVDATLDSAGTAVIRWIPPAADETSITINNPLSQIKKHTVNGLDLYYIDDLPFRINPMSVGNVFLSTPAKPNGYKLYDDNNHVVSLIGSSYLLPNTNIRVYSLPSYPAKSSIASYVNHTGSFNQTGTLQQNLDAYDLPLVQSFIPEINDGEYYFDESKNIIFSSYTGPSALNDHVLKVEYKPLKVYMATDEYGIVNQKQLYFTSDFYNQLLLEVSPANPLTITYDIVVNMVVKVHAPIGMSPANTTLTTTTGSLTFNSNEKYSYVTMIGKSIPTRIGL